MQREIRKLRTWMGRVIRDVQRKAGQIGGALKVKGNSGSSVCFAEQ